MEAQLERTGTEPTRELFDLYQRYVDDLEALRVEHCRDELANLQTSGGSDEDIAHYKRSIEHDKLPRDDYESFCARWFSWNDDVRKTLEEGFRKGVQHLRQESLAGVRATIERFRPKEQQPT